MSMEGLIDIMHKGLRSHANYAKNPSPPDRKEPQYLPELVNERLKGIMQPVSGCFHCHYAREAHQLMTLKAGHWTPDQFWIYPHPERTGMVMNQDRQYRVVDVVPGSAAEMGGLKAGDLLQTLAGERILTKYDIQWVLDKSDAAAVELPFSALRDGELVKGHLSLEAGWKVGDPEDYSWRVKNPFTAHMIKFLPTPGFIGDRLTPDELRALDLPEDRFALRVTQLNYGPHQAGIRLGDVILSAGGKSEFLTTRDFYAWCESMRREGRDIKIQVRREGDDMGMMVSLSYLNYSRVEKAPTVDLGFIPQQLPNDGGVRVGNVADDSSAEKAGIVIGDRVVSVDGDPVPDIEKFLSLLDQKSPGDLLMVRITRNGDPLEISFVLPGEGDASSDVARLSERVSREGQELSCLVAINLPTDKHIYSVHRKGMGQPTRVDFRGSGYRLIGSIGEPQPLEVKDPALGSSWVLHGQVELTQRIKITDPNKFHMVIRVYAQVCDDRSCHEFRAILENDGSDESFLEYRGDFEHQSRLSLH